MKIATLGEGITTKAVQAKVATLKGFSLTTNLAEADLVVTSPGIPPKDFPKITAPIISEIEFAYQLFHRPDSTYCPKIIGVTGTNGKTTVTSLLAEILDTHATGNIGVPLINYVDSNDKKPWLIVELSSYQLECCTTFRPEIAIWLNLTEDHIERHKTLQEYALQKAKIIQNQTEKDSLIYPDNEAFVYSFIKDACAKKIAYSSQNTDFLRLDNLKIKGQHNQLNALAAFLAAKEAGLNDEKILEAIRNFAPVEHRIELVTVHQGREFYNDSKGTNPDSTRIAVDAFQQPVNLIICGKDKGLVLEEFIKHLQTRVKSITLFGEIAGRFRAVSQSINADFPLFTVENIDQAIKQAYALSAENEVILFSPSSSSFDQFKNFEERGKIFKQLVHQYYG